MLVIFRPRPMRHLPAILTLAALLAANHASAALASAHPASVALRAPPVADLLCRVVSVHPPAAPEPPAWLLLGGALILLVAGRVAAS